MRKPISLVVITLIIVSMVNVVSLYSQPPYTGVELIIALRSLPETDYIMGKTGEFEIRTGIKVHYVLYPELELREKTVMDLATGAGVYDIIGIDNMYIPEFAEAGWIIPIEDYIRKLEPKFEEIFGEKYNLSDFMRVYRETNSYKGKMWAVPIYGETTQLMYRKDIFEDSKVIEAYKRWVEAHYDELVEEVTKWDFKPEQIPKELKVPENMAELLVISRFFAKKFNPESPVEYGISLRGLRGEGMNIYIWTGFLRAFGGGFFDENWRPIFNSSEGVKATEFYAYLLQNYGPPGSSTYTWDDVQTIFMAGKCAMIIDATNFLTRIENPELSAIAGKIGYAELPEGPAGKFPSIYTLGFTVSAIGAKEEIEREAGTLFIMWATSKSMELGKALIHYPPIVSVCRASAFLHKAFIDKVKAYPGWRESTVKGLEICLAEYRPRIPEWREVGDILGIAVEEVIAGARDAKSALDWAAAEATKILIRTGRLKG